MMMIGSAERRELQRVEIWMLIWTAFMVGLLFGVAVGLLVFVYAFR